LNEFEAHPLTKTMRTGITSFTALAIIASTAYSSAAAQTFSNRSAEDVDPELRRLLVEAIAEADSFENRFDAEVWLTDMSQRLSSKVRDTDNRLKILRTVHAQAKAVDIPPELVLAVIDVESNFDRFAISSASALGLMQIMPFWLDELGETDINRLFDIEFNVLLGCRILKYYLDMEDGDLIQALARYNGSTGQRWYGDRVLDRLRMTWFRG
jgi:soluble lytic murein transglycosylase-like protein